MRQPETREAAASQPGLSRQLIMDTAIALAEREGEDALSMRRIAQELDVWPMSLYRHFQDKQALLEALAEDAAEQISLPPAKDDWETRLRELLVAARTAFARHPGGLHLRLTGADLPPAAQRVTESGLAILGGSGLARKDVEVAWRALVDYLAGSAGSSAKQFEYGMELLVGGLRSRVSGPVDAQLPARLRPG